MSPSRDAFPDALQAALARLRSRERFSGEVQAWLLEKGFESEVVERVLSHLVSRRLLSDERALAAFAARRSGKRSVGPEILRAELLMHGAPEALIESHLTQQFPGETEAALEALVSSRKNMNRAQAGRFLIGRGFSEETVESVLSRRFLEEQAD